MDSTESWQVHGRTSENSSYLISHGWKRFCQENSLKEGDISTFYVVGTTLWHVVIMSNTLTYTKNAAGNPFCGQ
jgi:hypothetical protein